MATYPDIEVGDPIDDDTLNAMQYSTIIKSANQTIVSSTTFQDDSELVTPTLDAGKWSVWLDLLSSGGTPFKVEWTNTGTMTGNRRCVGPGSTETDTLSNVNAQWPDRGFATDNVYGYRTESGSPAQYWISEHSIITVTVAGAIQARWGQNASSAVTTTVHSGSFWKFKRVV